MAVVDFVCDCRVFESTNAIVVFNYNKDKGKELHCCKYNLFLHLVAVKLMTRGDNRFPLNKTFIAKSSSLKSIL